MTESGDATPHSVSTATQEAGNTTKEGNRHPRNRELKSTVKLAMRTALASGAGGFNVNVGDTRLEFHDVPSRHA